MTESIYPVDQNLKLIELNPGIPGFNHFIGAWLYTTKDSTFLIDVGPACCVPQLMATLASLKVKHLDYILLTHIHIDHAGGVGDLSAHYPKTPIVCHASGIDHLATPARLWQGTLKTLGDTAVAYGPFSPTPKDRLIAADRLESETIRPVVTLGHSAHHVSYIIDNYLFAGEAGGVCFSVEKPHDYLRPATPPRFYYNVYVGSLDRLIAEAPSQMCYGHYGLTDQAVPMLRKHREQLTLWRDIFGQMIVSDSTPPPEETFMNLLLSKDKNLSPFHHMPEMVQKRERYFLLNSIKGFIGDLKTV